MTVVDWVIMIFLAVAAVIGLAAGIHSCGSSRWAAWCLDWSWHSAITAAAAAILKPMIHSQRAANAVAFLAIAFVIMALTGIVGIVLAKLFRLIGLGLIDMLAGAVFGFAQGVLLVTVCILATLAFFPQASWLRTSRTPRLFFEVCNLTLHISPSKLAQRLQHDIRILKQGAVP